jgi:hypothetical protein
MTPEVARHVRNPDAPADGCREEARHVTRGAMSGPATTAAGDRLFVLGANPALHPMSDRRPAGDYFLPLFPWFVAAAESEAIAALDGDPPRVVVSIGRP